MGEDLVLVGLFKRTIRDGAWGWIGTKPGGGDVYEARALMDLVRTLALTPLL